MTEDWKQWEGLVVEGQFHLRQFLGGSEHSAVFLTGRGEGEGQPAAIKLIPADPGEAERQLARWRQAAALSHPHLIRLFEMGRCQLGGRALLYLVMEYAPENLAQILPERPLTPAEAREMLPPVLDALAFLHSKGLVHGHLKPANIMAMDDQLKISSDGICAAGEATGARGQPGAYDPPEAARTAKLPSGDVWSLGMTLVEALTQQQPAWQAVAPGEPALPESLPAPFREIARHCLLRDPQRRWSVAEIAAQLRPAPAATQPPSVVPPKASSRRRYLVPTLVVGLALAAIVVGTRLLQRPPQAQRGPAAARAPGKVQPPAEPSREPPGARPPVKPITDKQPGTARSAAKASPGNVVPGGVVHQVLPDVPQKARDTIQGTVRVRVRVQVDPAGDVTGADFDAPGPSRYFARLAMQAAREWRFEPPTVNGQKVASEWVLRFEFRKTGTRAVPTRATP